MDSPCYVYGRIAGNKVDALPDFFASSAYSAVKSFLTVKGPKKSKTTRFWMVGWAIIIPGGSIS
jgi:hypothetical protein